MQKINFKAFLLFAFISFVTLIALVIFFSFEAKADSPFSNSWIKTINADGYETIGNMAFDSNGNLYIAGDFSGTNVDFDAGTGTDTISTAGLQDIYITKYDSSGNYVWTKTIGGTGQDYCLGIGFDSSDNFYITGSINGTNVDFDPGAGSDLHTSASADIYIAKYDSDGNWVWAQTFGGASSEIGRGVSVDSTGVYIAGSFSSVSVDFDATAGTDLVTNSGGSDSFVTKYNLDSTYGWTRKIASTTIDDGFSVVNDSSHNVIFTGYYTGSGVDFDGTGSTDSHSSAGSYDTYIVKYDSSGNYIWARTFGGTGSDQGGREVTVDSDDNIYVSGLFNSADADFDATGGTDTHATNGNTDITLTKYLANGDYGWTVTYAGTGADWGRDVFVNGTTVYQSGRFVGTADLDPGAGTNSQVAVGDPDGFVSAFSTTDGSYMWSNLFPNAGWDDITELFYYEGALYVGGVYQGTDSDLDMTTGTSLFTSNAADDMFFSKYADSTYVAPEPDPDPTPDPTPDPEPTEDTTIPDDTAVDSTDDVTEQLPATGDSLFLAVVLLIGLVCLSSLGYGLYRKSKYV